MSTEAQQIAACPIKRGMVVVRKNNPQVRGLVRGVFVEYFRPWRVKARVAWEGATNGAQRIGGGDWTITRAVLASTLREVTE